MGTTMDFTGLDRLRFGRVIDRLAARADNAPLRFAVGAERSSSRRLDPILDSYDAKIVIFGSLGGMKRGDIGRKFGLSSKVVDAVLDMAHRRSYIQPNADGIAAGLSRSPQRFAHEQSGAPPEYTPSVNAHHLILGGGGGSLIQQSPIEVKTMPRTTHTKSAVPPQEPESEPFIPDDMQLPLALVGAGVGTIIAAKGRHLLEHIGGHIRRYVSRLIHGRPANRVGFQEQAQASMTPAAAQPKVGAPLAQPIPSAESFAPPMAEEMPANDEHLPFAEPLAWQKTLIEKANEMDGGSASDPYSQADEKQARLPVRPKRVDDPFASVAGGRYKRYLGDGPFFNAVNHNGGTHPDMLNALTEGTAIKSALRRIHRSGGIGADADHPEYGNEILLRHVEAANQHLHEHPEDEASRSYLDAVKNLKPPVEMKESESGRFIGNPEAVDRLGPLKAAAGNLMNAVRGKNPTLQEVLPKYQSAISQHTLKNAARPYSQYDYNSPIGEVRAGGHETGIPDIDNPESADAPVKLVPPPIDHGDDTPLDMSDEPTRVEPPKERTYNPAYPDMNKLTPEEYKKQTVALARSRTKKYRQAAGEAMNKIIALGLPKDRMVHEMAQELHYNHGMSPTQAAKFAEDVLAKAVEKKVIPADPQAAAAAPQPNEDIFASHQPQASMPPGDPRQNKVLDDFFKLSRRSFFATRTW